MSKLISNHELAEIVTGLLVNPALLGELDAVEQYKLFFRDIAHVVTSYCGGQASYVTFDCSDDPDDMVKLNDENPMIGVLPNDNLPDVNRNVWSAYDRFAFEGEDGYDQDKLMPTHEVDELRNQLRNLIFKGREDHELYHTLSLSTSHLPEEDIQKLTDLSIENVNFILVRDTGVFIKLYSELEYNSCGGLSDAYTSLIAYAASHGYGMIELDADAPVINAIPAFEW